jgi:hypothetical protein
MSLHRSCMCQGCAFITSDDRQLCHKCAAAGCYVKGHPEGDLVSWRCQRPTRALESLAGIYTRRVAR